MRCFGGKILLKFTMKAITDGWVGGNQIYRTTVRSRTVLSNNYIRVNE